MNEEITIPSIIQNTGKIDVFMVDPPWKKRKGGLRKSRHLQGREFSYETMETDDIFRLLDADIFPLSTDNHTVFMWTITYWYPNLSNSTFRTSQEAYAALIDRVSGRGTWGSNPFVMAYDFELID